MLVLFLSLIVILLIAGSLFIFRYRKWHAEFESNLDPHYLSKNYEEIPMDLQSRFYEFVASTEKNDFIEISVSEFADVLYFVAKQNDPESINVEKVYIEPSEGEWRIYVDFNIGHCDLPWMSLNLIKDERETAELYVRNMYIGDFDITKVIPGHWVNEINRGISDALLQFNENLFSKRYIQNIELLEDNVIIKGVLY